MLPTELQHSPQALQNAVHPQTRWQGPRLGKQSGPGATAPRAEHVDTGPGALPKTALTPSRRSKFKVKRPSHPDSLAGCWL